MCNSRRTIISNTRNVVNEVLKISEYYTIVFCVRCWFQPFSLRFQSGADPGGGAISPINTYESNFIYHNFIQFGKQHWRYKASWCRQLFCHSML